MTIKEISDLLDEKLNPIHVDIKEMKGDIASLKSDVSQVKSDIKSQVKIELSELSSNMEKVLAFVSVGNEDVTKKLKKLQKVAH